LSQPGGSLGAAMLQRHNWPRAQTRGQLTNCQIHQPGLVIVAITII